MDAGLWKENVFCPTKDRFYFKYLGISNMPSLYSWILIIVFVLYNAKKAK